MAILAAPVWGQEGLSIEEAVRQALASHPLLAAETSRIAAASGLVQQAGLRTNPRLFIQK
jgi:hypothetical protein